MTPEGFDKLVRYLEGAFRTQLEQHERDAYWLTLSQDDDAVTFRQAVAYVRSEDSKYGFPKPGDLIYHAPPAPPAYMVEAAETERLYGSRPALPPSAEEARQLLGPMREAVKPFPERSRKGSDNLRELRRKFPNPEGAA
jgi:hypothetical protein